ncbi:helix-turn-helix domain-containing protein [Alkalibacillus sp. S2W]|uniref:helix-turn-helix domain-containing protein n=1 Tax=Alkalibacillus sp. S2W TaxID=3386553 RepID=UPI00398D5F54
MDLKEVQVIMTAQDISDLLGISRKKVYELMNTSNEEGGIPVISIGYSKRVLKEDFLQWLTNQRDVSPM